MHRVELTERAQMNRFSYRYMYVQQHQESKSAENRGFTVSTSLLGCGVRGGSAGEQWQQSVVIEPVNSKWRRKTAFLRSGVNDASMMASGLIPYSTPQ